MTPTNQELSDRLEIAEGILSAILADRLGTIPDPNPEPTADVGGWGYIEKGPVNPKAEQQKVGCGVREVDSQTLSDLIGRSESVADFLRLLDEIHPKHETREPAGKVVLWEPDESWREMVESVGGDFAAYCKGLDDAAEHFAESGLAVIRVSASANDLLSLLAENGLENTAEGRANAALIAGDLLEQELLQFID